MARNTRKTSKPNGRKLSKTKGTKKQKGGVLGKENAKLEVAFSLPKDHFSDSFSKFFSHVEMNEKKIDDLIELFTEGIKVDGGRIKPSLDTKFNGTVRGSFIEKLKKQGLGLHDDFYNHNYNIMQFLIAKYPQFVVDFIDGLEEKGVDVSTQFFNKKYFDLYDSPKPIEVQYFMWMYLRLACKFLPPADSNINLIQTLINRYEINNGKESIKGIINEEWPNIHIKENCFLTLINVHNADKEDRVIEAMKLLISNGADEKYETERSAGVTGYPAYIGNALTKAKELNAKRETRGMFEKVIDYLENLGLTDPQEQVKGKGWRKGEEKVFT